MPGTPPSTNPKASPKMVLDLITGKWKAQAVCVAAELGIADILKDGPRSTQEIAAAANVSEDGVYRLLRALASLGLFASVSDGKFEVTPLGAYLRSDVPGSVRGFARFVGHDFTWRPWGHLLYSIRTGKPAFDHVFGMGGFDYLGKNPNVAAIANDAMTALTSAETMNVPPSFCGIVSER